ncbi:hypothetical protein NC652_006466 [Populus alba x Populus x berolinensis]|uniref:Uncharacterized protein n=1 Tax=Populus alba x Populus x berolinensis TaxID=444605 RepID=A0AAD6REC8_9ROSI|nr:hypothetical protein NC652_006466 [Populus alba x Populus x berolinensis]KAJ7007319.1 hypothetical protein NC653_006380 [Populus alba x Populus x berolinensis]
MLDALASIPVKRIQLLLLCVLKIKSFTSRLVATSGLPGFPTENLDDLAYVKEYIFFEFGFGF